MTDEPLATVTDVDGRDLSLETVFRTVYTEL